MPLKKYKPYTPSRRFMTVIDYSQYITKEEPEKSLTIRLKSTGGRNNLGRVTARFRGGGNKKLYRIIDFKRNKFDIVGTIESIEYDPYRSAFISLVRYEDGEKRYIIAPEGIKVGDKVISYSLEKLENNQVEPEIKIGNSLPLRYIPEGVPIHNIELIPGRGGQLVRAAGTQALILSKEGNYAFVQLPSGEVRKINLKCRATIGQVSNVDWENITWGKAGRMRWMGIRPHVRGMAMNPVDHPQGGGEGRGKGRIPRGPSGVLSKGGKTRNPRKTSSKFIVKRRK
ncbi:MAG: 50S ribosomal protein L2 [candidate division WOR-3 bacterium]|jgi:large subunit ribosomal protein L2